MDISFRDLRPDVPLLDDSQVLEIYADGIATMEMLGHNVRMTYFTWGCPRGGIVCRTPVIKVVRPARSFTVGRVGLLGMIPKARSLLQH